MELDNIKKLRDEMEQTFFNILADFEKRTGIAVENQVWVSHYDKHDDRKRAGIEKVEINIASKSGN